MPVGPPTSLSTRRAPTSVSTELRRNGASQLVYKHSIATIVPASPVEGLELEAPADDLEAHVERGHPGYWLSFPVPILERHARLVRDAELDGRALSVDFRIDTWEATGLLAPTRRSAAPPLCTLT